MRDGKIAVKKKSGERVVIFLDSDGVLQPHSNQNRLDYDLHYYLKDRTDNRTWRDREDPKYSRAGEVKEYLDAHPEIERFVIIDDGCRDFFDALFPDQFVHALYRMNFENELCARQILAGQIPHPDRPKDRSIFQILSQSIDREPQVVIFEHNPHSFCPSSKRGYFHQGNHEIF